MKRLAAILSVMVLAAGLFSGCSGKEKADGAAQDDYRARLESCKKQIEEISDFKPDVAIIMGSGVNEYAKTLDVVEEISCEDIEGWPTTTAPKNKDKLLFAEKNGLKLAVMLGRPHYFDGYTGEEVVLPLRVLHMLGAETVIFVSTVGSLNPDFHVGDFVSVSDHISSYIDSPLIGENIDELGERYVDMTHTYDKGMQDALMQTGKANGIPIHSGVYLEVPGPQYETPAEIQVYRETGADTISMSDVAEAIAASHMGMKVCALNCISNMGAGMEETELSHDDMMEATKGVEENLVILLDGLLGYLK